LRQAETSGGAKSVNRILSSLSWLMYIF
jgi:hypothetical protein